MVIISSFGHSQTYRSDGTPYSPDQLESVWDAGLGRTLDALPSQTRAVVLADTPYPGIEIPPCLTAHPHNIAACERPRAVNGHPVHAAAEAQVAADHGAGFANLGAVVCSYDPCPVVAGNVIMWTDGSHMTATFSRTLGPSMRRVITDALSP